MKKKKKFFFYFCRVIHSNRCLHRDLKLDNILISNGIFKIADFGLSKPSELGMTYCGTTTFMAPEIQKHL
jgi:serine/threonine protein kinase